MRIAAYVGGLLGLLLLVGIGLQADLAGMWRITSLAAGDLLWLAPYRLVFFLLYALGWAVLLVPYDPERHIGLAYVFWVTTVREAIDRLLPTASVGGAVVGVRLMHLRDLPIAAAGATVIVEILLTLVAVYCFTNIGLLLLVEFHSGGLPTRYLIIALVLSFPVPVLSALLLRYGSVFARLEGLLRRIAGIQIFGDAAVALDQEIKSCLARKPAIVFAGALQLAALLSGSLEIWFVLRIVGHPIDISSAVIMESLMQAVRHLAFVVPAGIGVQEAALVVFGHTVGVGSDLALTVSLAKRVRELVCGVPSLISWSLLEGRRHASRT